jgi:uncharacterized cupredoxin-like copper-binding protein
MATVQQPPEIRDEPARPETDGATIAALNEIRRDVHEQSQSIRRTQQAFTIFAAMALLLAMASLLAVALKLDRKPRTITQRPAAVAAAPPAARAPVTRNVDVSLAQFSVSPSASRAPAGRVTFRVHNAGTITHELVVIKTAHAASDLPLTNGRADESGNVGETGDLKPGLTKSVSLKLAAGHYALICNLPGHYLAGQHTDFTVG